MKRIIGEVPVVQTFMNNYTTVSCHNNINLYMVDGYRQQENTY